jgi:hypothetical protein
MAANPDGGAAESPGGRNLSHALGNMGDVARFNSEAAKRFLKDGQVRFVTASLFSRDNQVKLYLKLLECCSEQVVVDIQDDGKPVSACQSS